MLGVTLAVTLVTGPLLALAVLTALGARRRGAGQLLSLVEGLLFPFAWVAW